MYERVKIIRAMYTLASFLAAALNLCGCIGAHGKREIEGSGSSSWAQLQSRFCTHILHAACFLFGNISDG